MATTGTEPTGGRRPGRRPAGSGTREAILDAARAAFFSHGYDRTTIRAVARDAGVDPALVHHYFGTKQGLFVAALHFPFDPSAMVARVLDGDREGVGERLVRMFLTVWEDERLRGPVVGLVRSALTNDTAAAMLREFISEALVARIAERLGLPDARLRPSLVGAQLVGLVVLRYIIRLEPLASADPEQLVAAVGPTVQRYLTGELDH